MMARILPREEWHRLEVCDLPVLLQHVDPQNVSVVAVEENGELIATLSVLTVTHLEGLWIKPDRRGSPEVVRKLLKKAIEEASKAPDHWVMAQSASPKMDDLIERSGGVEMPVKTFILSVGV